MKDELVLSLPKYVGWVGLGWISVLTVMIRDGHGRMSSRNLRRLYPKKI